MSDFFAENTTFNGFENTSSRQQLFNLPTACRTLPLVQRIVVDILHDQQRLHELENEKTDLDRRRHHLSWPERSRRYRLAEEVSSIEDHLQETMEELDQLGVTLLDPDTGRIGFLTVVNGDRAYFSWRPLDVSVQFWHFADEGVRRPIPSSWYQVEVQLVGIP